MTTLYSRVLTYASILIVLLAIVYTIYLYYFAPIPGDTTTVSSITLRKNNPIRTNTKERVGKGIKMTNTGAFSFIFAMDEVHNYGDDDPVMYPILTFHKGSNDLQDGPISTRILYNRLTSELVLGFYDNKGDVYTIPISTSLYKDKVSVVVRLMNVADNNSFLVNVYLNGEYISSRGIPSTFGGTGGVDHTVVVGDNNGVNGRIQYIRVWDNARDLTDTDFMKVSQDPFIIHS
jgi:hypothetical protein